MIWMLAALVVLSVLTLVLQYAIWVTVCDLATADQQDTP